MKTLRMMKIIEKMGLALLVIGCLGFIVPGLEAATIKVNCNSWESVQSALDKLTGPATIVVKGTCRENVLIIKNDVTIKGGTFVGSDQNQDIILVQGARRVLLTGATVGGARNGVVSYQGGSVTVDSCTIQNNTSDGVLATANSSLFLLNSTIANNGGGGVNVYEGSGANIGVNFQGESKPNTIQNNGVNGIKVYQSSRALIANNTIQDNAAYGILIMFGSSARLTNNTVKSNNIGIGIAHAGSARIGINDDGYAGLGNTIESNQLEGIVISNSAAAQLLNNIIRGNGLLAARPGIGIYRATGHLVGDNTIEGNGTHGVQVNQGTLVNNYGGFTFTPGRDIIKGNHASGISAWNAASLDIQNATVENNAAAGIVLSLRSTLRIYDSTVSNNRDGIGVYEGSAAAFYHPTGVPWATLTNNLIGVNCGGTEASITGDLSGVTGNGVDVSSNCSPF